MDYSECINQLEKSYKEIEPDQEVEVRKFQPKDAHGITRLYYEIYDKNFPVKRVYSVEETIKCNQSGEHHNIVAVTQAGEVVGTIALQAHAPNKNIYEAGQLMVSRGYRSSNIAQRLSRYCSEIVHTVYHAPVSFSSSVTNHRFTQRAAVAFKYKVTGIEVECMSSDAYQKENAGRETNVSLVIFFNIHEKTSCNAYLPPVYKEMISDIYTRLEVTRNVLTGGSVASSSKKDEFVLLEKKFIRMNFSQIGTDFETYIKEKEKELGKGWIIQVCLNLGDPASTDAVSSLRKMGYFFGSVLPCWFNTDGLLMQKVPQQPVWQDMLLYGKETKRLHAFIQADYDSVKKEQANG